MRPYGWCWSEHLLPVRGRCTGIGPPNFSGTIWSYATYPVQIVDNVEVIAECSGVPLRSLKRI
jgi:hypothetical protein